MSQPDFLYELFEDFMDDPANQDFSMDNGLVCRWLTGQAKISPKISAYYSKPSNQKKLAETIHQNLLPLMSDCNMAMQDIYTLFIQDDTITTAAKPITIAANKQNTAITIPAINARIPAPSGITIGNPITTIAMIMANFSHLFVHGFFSWLS